MGLFSWLLGKPADSAKISKEGIRIDVRTKEECRSGMISGAKNIPLDVLTSKIANVVKDKDQLIGVYCQSGMRSAMAKRKLKAMGYTNVWNEGSYFSVQRKISK